MKKFFSLVLALVMALSLTTVAWGANPTTLPDAVDGVITLTSDVDLTAAFVVDGTSMKIEAPAPGYTIDASAVGDAFQATNGGTLTLGANVTITSTKALLWANGGTIIVDGANITVDCDTDGLACAWDADGNEGVLTIKSGTVAFTGQLPDNGAAIIASKGGTVNVEGGTVYATNCSVLCAKEVSGGGTINVSGGTIYTESADGHVAVYAKTNGTVEISGGTISDPVASTGGTVNISGGNVYSVKDSHNNGDVNVTGGTFDVAPDAAYLNGLTTMVDTNGNYYVTAPVTMGDKFDLYLADAGMNAALKLKTPDVAGLSFNEVAAKSNKDGSGNVAYIAANNGQYFVKTSAPTVADYAVTDAGKNTVLYYVTVAGTSAANFTYEEAVSAFANFGAKCGQVNITPVAGETYFKAADGDVYMAVAAGTGVNYLLNGKVVSGVYAGTPEEHTFVINNYKYDATLKQNIPTSAVCTKCLMNTNSIYPNTKVPATYTVYPTTGEGSNQFTVALPSTTVGGTVVAPSTDKVQSAETFDAGIAMYVGMSVMAAAGSAVVLKKKD